MLMLPDIEQWSTCGNYGYLRQDVYLNTQLKEIDLIRVRMDKDYEVIQVSGHVPSLNMWVEFLTSAPSRMP